LERAIIASRNAPSDSTDARVAASTSSIKWTLTKTYQVAEWNGCVYLVRKMLVLVSVKVLIVVIMPRLVDDWQLNRYDYHYRHLSLEQVVEIVERDERIYDYPFAISLHGTRNTNRCLAALDNPIVWIKEENIRGIWEDEDGHT
jgi:hypothetical protein